MIEIGKRLFGAGVLALGAAGLVWSFAAPWQPMPHELPGYVPLAYATAFALIASAAAHGIAGLTALACLTASLLMGGPGLRRRPKRAM